MGRTPPKQLTIPSVVTAISTVNRTIMSEVEARGYGEQVQFAIRLALDEAVSNAIHHGNGNDPSKFVRIEYSIDDREARISVCDEGRGFNPKTLPDPTVHDNLMKPNGRGVMLIRAYMTEVSYNDEGNCVTMVKRRDCGLPVSLKQRA